jgi:hypothetical protein
MCIKKLVVINREASVEAKVLQCKQYSTKDRSKNFTLCNSILIEYLTA